MKTNSYGKKGGSQITGIMVRENRSARRIMVPNFKLHCRALGK